MCEIFLLNVKCLRRELIYFISLSALAENFTIHYVVFHRFHSKQFHGAVDVWKRNFNHVEQLFDYSSAVRKVMYTTYAVESINSSFRKVTRKGAFPNENALLKLLYLRTTELYKKWNGSKVQNWAMVRNQLAVNEKVSACIEKYDHMI